MSHNVHIPPNMRTNVTKKTMLVIFLVLTQISAEWVEISQQHYRKPIRIHSVHNPFTSTDKIEIEDTTKSWTYKVSRLSDFNWTKATENQAYTINSELRQQPSTDGTEIIYDKQQNLEEDKPAQVLTTLAKESSDIDKQKGIIERVPSKGNVNRVQLKNNPVKSPVLYNKNDAIRNRYEEYPLDSAGDVFENKKKILTNVNNRRIYLDQHRTDLTDTSPIIGDSTHGDSPKQRYKNHTLVENVLLPTPTFITATKQLTHVDEIDEFYKIAQNNMFTTETPILHDQVVSKHSIINRKQTNNNQNSNTNKDRIKIVEKQTMNKITSGKFDTNPNDINNNLRTNKDNNNATPVQEPNIENKIHDIKTDVNELRKDDKNSKESKPQNKVTNMDNLLKLLKAVTETISQNSRRTFGGKIKYLNELKDSILENIADRIETTWPDDVTAEPRRTSRSAKTSPRGQHLHFPSSESALMTISFLTFAVFLIKLVLQLIQTYKSKAMMVAPVMVASASRAART